MPQAVPFVALAVTAAGTAYSVHQGQMAKKEQERQKSIAAAQMKEQEKFIAEEAAKKAAEEKALQDELEAKRRADIAKANEVVSADQTRKAKLRGRRSLIYGSEQGVTDEFKSTLG